MLLVEEEISTLKTSKNFYYRKRHFFKVQKRRANNHGRNNKSISLTKTPIPVEEVKTDKIQDDSELQNSDTLYNSFQVPPLVGSLARLTPFEPNISFANTTLNGSKRPINLRRIYNEKNKNKLIKSHYEVVPELNIYQRGTL